ncbi:hypothetical protein DSO57_1032001 [Entomophthora muscae]|uniref:Uncharacterized protein n=1 Tax=Entomophthora muscae TaxID=34485 RepID=A0ACC2RRK8_9FUNG|nr:hypothetical protein DSO57_1032001 [Entomophthora muscae]
MEIKAEESVKVEAAALNQSKIVMHKVACDLDSNMDSNEDDCGSWISSGGFRPLLGVEFENYIQDDISPENGTIGNLLTFTEGSYTLATSKLEQGVDGVYVITKVSPACGIISSPEIYFYKPVSKQPLNLHNAIFEANWGMALHTMKSLHSLSSLALDRIFFNKRQLISLENTLLGAKETLHTLYLRSCFPKIKIVGAACLPARFYVSYGKRAKLVSFFLSERVETLLPNFGAPGEYFSAIASCVG